MLQSQNEAACIAAATKRKSNTAIREMVRRTNYI